MTWRVEMLGGLRLRYNEHVIRRFRTQKTGALLAYLALHKNQRHPREELCELFWPESTPEAARTNLRVALASLRCACEVDSASDIFYASYESVQLHDAVTTDVEEFEEAATTSPLPPAALRTRLAGMIGCYTGPFLPGCFEDWAHWERSRLEDIYRAALWRLATLHEQAGDLACALDCAHRAVQLDPLCEESHALLIRLYLASGQREAAARQYRACETALREGLDVSPLPTTSALLETSPKQSQKETPLRPTLLQESLGQPPSPVAPRITPTSLTRFFGRAAEMKHVAHLLSPGGARLVTLLGPGGAGKTRLAQELMAELGSRTGAQRAVFVPLAAITDAAALLPAIGEALSLPGKQMTLEATVAALQNPSTLLVLDNFEQIVSGGREILQTLLTRVPELICLVTSRHRLHIPGEQLFPIPPLPVPRANRSPTELMYIPSVQLFVDRVQSVRPQFTLDAEHAEAVADLCVRLEGIPLAIELAAAWSGVLSPDEMRARLQHRLDFLVSPNISSDKHRTMRATIAWSYTLLSPELERFWRLLSIFQAGWTLESAMEVCDEPCALQYILALSERSLVVAEEAPGSIMRYRMLETIREFAAERLVPAEYRLMLQRQTAYYLRLVQSADFDSAAAAHWYARIEAEAHSMNAVWRASIQVGEIEAGIALAIALDWFWLARSYPQERRAWRRLALQHKDALPPDVRGEALWRIAQFEPAPIARELLEEFHLLAREAGNRQQEGWALIQLGEQDVEICCYDSALERYEQAYTLWQSVPEADTLLALASRCGLLCFLGQYERVRPLLYECLDSVRRLERLGAVAKIETALGVIAMRQGRTREGMNRLAYSRGIYQQLGDRGNTVLVLRDTAITLAVRGELEAAKAMLAEAEEQEQSGGQELSDHTLMARLEIATRCLDREIAEATYREIVSRTVAQFATPDRWDAFTLDRMGRVWLYLSRMAMAHSDGHEALRLLTDALQLLRRAETRDALAWTLAGLAQLRYGSGYPDEGMAALMECLALCAQCGLLSCRERLYRTIGILLSDRSPLEAMRLLRIAQALREEMEIRLIPSEQQPWNSAVTKLAAHGFGMHTPHQEEAPSDTEFLALAHLLHESPDS